MNAAIEQGRTIESEQSLGTATAGLALPVHSLSIRPEEDVPVQQSVPIGRLEPVHQRPGQRGRRHWSLVADEHALRETERVRSMAAQQRRALRFRHADQAEQPLGTHEPMLKNRRKVVRLGQVVKALDRAHQTAVSPALTID
jgi:hypothetical protein